MNEQTRNALELARASLENFWLNGQSTQSERAEASQAIAAIDAALSAPAAPVAQPLTNAIAAELDRIANEPPISGNKLAQARVQMAAANMRAHGIRQGADDA